jgi:hypothetical protein
LYKGPREIKSFPEVIEVREGDSGVVGVWKRKDRPSIGAKEDKKERIG